MSKADLDQVVEIDDRNVDLAKPDVEGALAQLGVGTATRNLVHHVDSAVARRKLPDGRPRQHLCVDWNVLLPRVEDPGVERTQGRGKARRGGELEALPHRPHQQLQSLDGRGNLIRLQPADRRLLGSNPPGPRKARPEASSPGRAFGRVGQPPSPARA